MKAEQHRARAERIERSLAKLTSADSEAMIDACMLASSQWINVGLHSLGVSADDDDFIHPFMLDGRQRQALEHALGAEAMRASDAIEGYRPFFVRGDDPGGTHAAARARALLETVREQVKAALGEAK